MFCLCLAAKPQVKDDHYSDIWKTMEMDVADKMSERIYLEQLQRGREAERLG